MLTEAEKEGIEKGFKTIMIIWAAIFACLFIYLVMALVAGEGIRQGSSGSIPIPLFRNILICVSIIEIFIIRVIRRILLSESAVHKLDESNIPSNQVPAVFQYNKAIIISSALADSIGIYGLVLYFVGAGLTTLYLFLGGSALVMLFHKPRKEELINLAIEYEMGLSRRSSVH